MAYLTIKIIKNNNAKHDLKIACNNTEIVENFGKILDGETPYRTFYVTEDLLNSDLKSILNDSFDHIDIRDGVDGGCYGARDGKKYEGVTVFTHIKNFDERWIDTDGDEVVNPWSLLEDHATSFSPISDEIHEALTEIFDFDDDNTCNYEGQSSEDPYFLTGMHFEILKEGEITSDKNIMLVRFHEGGDIRGNYGSWHLAKFDYIDDLYSVIHPTCQLKEVE